MLRLRTSDGGARDLEERYHVDPPLMRPCSRMLAKPGLTEHERHALASDRAGFLVSNSIINMITDAASR